MFRLLALLVAVLALAACSAGPSSAAARRPQPSTGDVVYLQEAATKLTARDGATGELKSEAPAGEVDAAWKLVYQVEVAPDGGRATPRTTIRAVVDGITITATDAAYSAGWWGVTSDMPFAMVDASATDGGTTAWTFGAFTALPPEWAHLSTAELPHARAQLTIRDAPNGATGLSEITATVSWDEPRNRGTATSTTWAYYP